MEEKESAWSVSVEKIRENSYITMFNVGSQHFTLACAADDEEAEEHCTFIAKMFLSALKKAGMPNVGEIQIRDVSEERDLP